MPLTYLLVDLFYPVNHLAVNGACDKQYVGVADRAHERYPEPFKVEFRRQGGQNLYVAVVARAARRVKNIK